MRIPLRCRKNEPPYVGCYELYEQARVRPSGRPWICCGAEELAFRCCSRLSLRQDEGDLSLADHFALDVTNSFGFADFAPRFGQFDFDDKRVAGPHRFA